ncbi:MAG TPA: response regulator, partial [Candidatus Acidoferrum sp.]|nr:response regulator [Candidatus Acidoferrum sp.]
FLSSMALMMGFRFYMYVTLPSMTGFVLPRLYHVCLLGNAAVWGLYAVWIVNLSKELNNSSAITIMLLAGAACGGAVAISMNLLLARALCCLYLVPLTLYAFAHYEQSQVLVMGFLLCIFIVYLCVLSAKQNKAYWKMLNDADKLRAQAHELTEARSEAVKANQMRSDFLAHVSHEIRTPLNGIIGVARELAASPLDDRQQDQVNLILQSGKLAAGLVSDVVEFSEISAEYTKAGPVDVDLVALANEILNVLEPMVRPRGNRLELIDRLDRKQWIKVDAIRLEQLLTNLLSNANRVTQGGRIELYLYFMPGVRSEQDLIRGEVHDEGSTLTAAQQRQLLEAYQQTGRVDPNGRAAGLGLAICSRLIKLLGGRLGIKNDQQGSCFWFEIPYVAGTPIEVAKAIPAKAVNANAPLILVVEDNPMNQRVVTTFLNKLQYPYLLAATGRQACDVWEQHKPRFVLMDYGLPDITGMDATRNIRKLEQEHGWTPCTIIAVTAHGANKVIEEFFAAGMNDHLPKPVTLRSLQSMLDKWS